MMRAVLFLIGCTLAQVFAQDCGRLDIVVILDNSGSVAKVFEKEKNLALDLTGGIPIQIGGSQVGVVSFAQDATVRVPLYPPKSRNDVLTALSSIEHRGGSTNVVDSFVKARELFKRSTAPTKVIVIVTDGNSQNKWTAIGEEVKAIRRAGISVYATTQSDDYAEKELRFYTGDARKVFNKNEVGDLRRILTQLAGPNCKPPTKKPGPVTTTTKKPVRTRPTPKPTRRTRPPRRTTTQRADTRRPTTTTTQKPTTTFFIPSKGGCKADILFVVDTSGSVLRDFREEVIFAERLVRDMDLGKRGKQKVAVVEYSAYNKQNLFIPWGKHQETSTELIERMDEMEYYGGTTYTERALLLAKKVIDEGRRPGAHLLVILIHDGISYDQPARVAKEIRELPKTEIIAVGVNKLVLTETLVDIAGDQNNVFVGTDIEEVAGRVLTRIARYFTCKQRDVATPPPPTKTTTRRTPPPPPPVTTPKPVTTTTADPGPGHCVFDMLIILDSSGSVEGDIFRHEIERTVRIVRRLTVAGPKGSRVGFIKFAGPGTARTEFPMNKYKNKNDIEDAIRNTKFTSGTTAAGDALRLAVKELDPSRGLRPGIAKSVVIVVTDGLSQQPVKQAARALKAKADYVYSFATDKFFGPDQLKEIASGPDKWFTGGSVSEKKRFEKAMDSLTSSCGGSG